jgi:muramidase (phage lysozyme)
MLDLTTLVAVSIVGTAATPLNGLSDMKRLEYPVPQQVAIREIAPETTLESGLICTGCDPTKFLPAPAYELTPERRALLNTIRFAEGTWTENSRDGYRILFGGRMVSSLKKHPNQIQYSVSYASAAAGAYQFLPGTWDEAAKKLKLLDFEPNNQDQAALYLVERRNALSLADSGKITPTLIAKLAPEWASLPTYGGNSYYSQPVKRYEDLRRFYESNLAMLRQEAI